MAAGLIIRPGPEALMSPESGKKLSMNASGLKVPESSALARKTDSGCSFPLTPGCRGGPSDRLNAVSSRRHGNPEGSLRHALASAG